MMMFSGLVIASFLSGVKAGDFLEPQNNDELIQVDVQNVLLDLYDHQNNPQVVEVLKHVAPMYRALPKNKFGRLDSSTVCYAVHRYFVQRYGWYVAGLDPAGGSSKKANVSQSIMKDRAPAFIGSLFEDMLGEKGFGDQELAVFAATLADLIHREASMRLQDIHTSFKFGTGMTWDQSAKSLKVFLAELIIGAKVRSERSLQIIDANMLDVYSAWDDTLVWATDSSRDYEWNQVRNPFIPHQLTFDDNAAYLYHIQEHYTSYQNLECKALKTSLLDLEHEGTGRVRLGKFYSGGVGGDWKFTESTEYLRNLGVLDETDPQNPSVVISNYLTSKTNCVSSSKFYSVCCSDECEGLMQHIETALGSPRVSPADLVSVVSGLPSDTVAAPRNLSSALLSRLDSVAAVHQGMIPLHGRLFAQWLHHAYPRECPFPHVAGSIKPVTPDEWITEFGSVEATVVDMMEHHNNSMKEAPATDGVAADALPWTMVEELVSSHEDDKRRGASVWKVVRPIMAVLALGSVVSPLVKMWSTACVEQKGDRVLV